MLSLYLNLLSVRKRAKLAQLIKFFYVKEMLEILVFTAALLGLAHLLAWYVLVFTLHNVAETSLLITRENSGHNQEIRAMNAIIKNVAEAGKGYAPLSPKLAELIGALPPDIKLASMDLDRAPAALALSGTAKTRSALLNFQTALEKLPWIAEVTVPRSQLFQKDNVNFEIHAGLRALPPLPARPVAPAKSATAPARSHE